MIASYNPEAKREIQTFRREQKKRKKKPRGRTARATRYFRAKVKNYINVTADSWKKRPPKKKKKKKKNPALEMVLNAEELNSGRMSKEKQKTNLPGLAYSCKFS